MIGFFLACDWPINGERYPLFGAWDTMREAVLGMDSAGWRRWFAGCGDDRQKRCNDGFYDVESGDGLLKGVACL